MDFVQNKESKDKIVLKDYNSDLSFQQKKKLTNGQSKIHSTIHASEDMGEDYLEEIKMNKVDYSKIKKQDILVEDKSIQNHKTLNGKKTLITNTEKYLDTRYPNTINTHFSHIKNNLNNNQNNFSNGASEINSFSPINSSGSNNSQQQGSSNTQSQTTSNNFNTINEIKEMLDMTDRRWANNLVARLQKAHSSNINELELILTPKSLGKMKIKISLSGNAALVNIKTDNSSAASLVLEQENKLNGMFKQVGLELEDFSLEESFQQSSNDKRENDEKNDPNEASKANKPSDNEQEDNYINDESLLNIKV